MADEAIWRAVLQGAPLMSDQSFPKEEAQLIVTLRKLRAVGVADAELRGLLEILRSGNHAEKIGRLRRLRFQLLEGIHAQQQALDGLDYYTNVLKQARK